MRKVFQFVDSTSFTGAIYRTGHVAENSGVSRALARAALRRLAADYSLYEFRPGYFRVTPWGPLAEGRSTLCDGARGDRLRNHLDAKLRKLASRGQRWA